ncbi:uroporphyrin-III C-methyltransferase/precorrin-2 dehydrogenase/sirohydrochlorin ferrochelatase [Devosia subaequoris]|uniref:Uroporphyrin-III C-methyltransferase/precorrin-2 dehydrogenase/sirohydrochlorin ferrochelatase n=1 Tax=Devosia subaequoris TaxID=395930 RepID=A0A7W6IL12_9HYPH|nr:uroporphyrin-III C-methyltransferase/precorrin-2 dehydrogenase/sirohydrochlorin ferrochelatase [Devosia subaequoris]MCP1209122.1 siroheme synthase CysG [Devosia subaequoris]
MARLNTFPVSFAVRGKRIVIIGGDGEALAKARLAAKTSAEVVLFAERFTADFAGLDVRLVSRPLEVGDLANTALVFVADHGPAGARALNMARAAGIPVNEVDVPANCDFYTPSIVDRAPLTVAISTEGEAPVLARLVRAQVEALLAPGIGKIASLAGGLRGKVESLIHDGAARRRYYEDLVTRPDADITVAEELLADHAANGAGQGVVWLIGAGPGSEDLLTLRAQRLLQQADVIVHDQLVPAAVVEMGRRDAEQICVGKARGHHSFSQAQINTLIVRLAGEGKRVARLKSGDPMVFGRAGEEIAALRKAGIAYQIVPGVSAALAAAADSATPVTLRKVSSGFVMATAHGADDGDLAHWAALSQSGLTLALYMGKAIAADVAGRLLSYGAAQDLPVGIVVNAGRANRTLYAATLGQLAAGAVDFVDGPAVILVGRAVAESDWANAADAAASSFKVA